MLSQRVIMFKAFGRPLAQGCKLLRVETIAFYECSTTEANDMIV